MSAETYDLYIGLKEVPVVETAHSSARRMFLCLALLESKDQNKQCVALLAHLCQSGQSMCSPEVSFSKGVY